MAHFPTNNNKNKINCSKRNKFEFKVLHSPRAHWLDHSVIIVLLAPQCDQLPPIRRKHALAVNMHAHTHTRWASPYRRRHHHHQHNHLHQTQNRRHHTTVAAVHRALQSINLVTFTTPTHPPPIHLASLPKPTHLFFFSITSNVRPCLTIINNNIIGNTRVYIFFLSCWGQRSAVSFYMDFLINKIVFFRVCVMYLINRD